MRDIAALGMIECSSMSQGSVVADAMLKTSTVHLIMAQPVPPGKLLVVIEGNVAEVEAAVTVGLDSAGRWLEDALFIPRLHPDVGKALITPLDLTGAQALGMVETKTVAAAIRAADASLKAARVRLASIRLGLGIGGKAIYYVTGTVADTNAAVEAGKAAVKVDSLLIHTAVIPQPDAQLSTYLVTGPGQTRPLPGAQAPPEA
jgi:microcompartment protein CcmL/EutN